MTKSEIKEWANTVGLENVGVRELRDGTMTLMWGRGIRKKTVTLSADSDRASVLAAVRAANGP